MVMKKRLDNGFTGFSDWTVPRGPRSLRVSKIASSDLSLMSLWFVELHFSYLSFCPP